MDGRLKTLAERVPDLQARSFVRTDVLPPVGRAHALVLHRGEVALHVEGRLFAFRRAPALLLPRHGVRITAMDDVCAGVVELSQLDREALAQLYEDEISRLEAWRADELRKADDFFADARGTLVPGPYRFGPYPATVLSFRGETAGVLPHGLRPFPGLRDRFLVVLSQIERVRALHSATDGREHRYVEVAAFVPCLGPSLRPGLFVPEVYPDAYLPVLLGREVYGFSKRLGRVLLQPDGFDLVAGGSHRLRVRWDEREGRSPAWLHDALKLARWITRMRRPRLFLHKRIADVRSGARARTAIDQLVSLPFSVHTLAESVVLGGAWASFPDGKWSLKGRCEAAARLTIAFSFGDGHVLRSRRSTPYP